MSEVTSSVKSIFPNITDTKIGRIVRQCFPNCKRQRYSRGPYHYYGLRKNIVSVLPSYKIAPATKSIAIQMDEKRKTTVKSIATQMKTECNIPPAFCLSKTFIETMVHTKTENIGHGSFGTVSICKYRGIIIAVKTYHNRKSTASKIRDEALCLLNIRPHSSIPMLYGICYEKQMILLQFCGHHDRSVTIWKLTAFGSWEDK